MRDAKSDIPNTSPGGRGRLFSYRPQYVKDGLQLRQKLMSEV